MQIALLPNSVTIPPRNPKPQPESSALPRAARLLDLIQLLRGHRYPVTGAKLAADLRISLRTLYRDIVTLQAQGAGIEGEAGIGFVLRPGFMLPPLMFSPDEIEALVLGVRWVAGRGDAQLGAAAQSLLAKIAAVLPEDLRGGLDSSSLLVPCGPVAVESQIDLGQIRRAIRAQRKLVLDYADARGQKSRRTVWPFALGYFEACRVIAAWCETRQDFRHFRCDRITGLEMLDMRYAERREVLLKRWREHQGVNV